MGRDTSTKVNQFGVDIVFCPFNSNTVGSRIRGWVEKVGEERKTSTPAVVTDSRWYYLETGTVSGIECSIGVGIVGQF